MKEEDEGSAGENVKASGAVVTDFVSSLNSYVIVIALFIVGLFFVGITMLFLKYCQCKWIFKAYLDLKKDLFWSGILGTFSLAYIKCLAQFCSTISILLDIY